MIRTKHIGIKILIAVAASVIIAMLIMTVYFTKQQRQNIMAENERTSRKLMETVSKSVNTIMIEGEANIAQRFANSLKSIPGILEFWIIRTDGLESFRDNKTILNVNKRIGNEEFFPRNQEEEVQLLSRDNPMLEKVIQTEDLIMSYGNALDGL